MNIEGLAIAQTIAQIVAKKFLAAQNEQQNEHL